MDAKTRREKQQAEVDANFAAFKEQLPELLARSMGKFALMKGRKVVELFDTDNDAIRTGRLLFSDGFFSVQKVTNEVIDLRLWRHALRH